MWKNTLKVIDFLEGTSEGFKGHHPSLPESPYHSLYQRYFPTAAAPFSPLK
jgi:O-acetylhomoserine (thiol)-lyase